MIEFWKGKNVKCLDDLIKLLEQKASQKRWLFRGWAQLNNKDGLNALKPSFEEGRDKSGVSDDKLLKIERLLIREFRRKYDGSDRHDIEADTLYCLSMMRHHQAPTRLLDWTYSPYVAIYFALEHWWRRFDPNRNSSHQVVLWCLDASWCSKAAKAIYPAIKDDLEKFLDAPENIESNPDAKINKDILFKKIFMNKENEYRIVCPVNSYHQHPRLIVQQGVFLCPGNVKVPLSDILSEMSQRTEELRDNWPIVKIRWRLKYPQKDYLDALDVLHRMNISRSSLFPGLDGFAESLKHRLNYFQDMPTISESPPR